MNLFDVYPLYDIYLKKGSGAYVYDKEGNKYLDFYGGHAVISIGHSHREFVKAITKQVEKLAYYSNSVHISLQNKLAKKLGKASGYDNYQLFLCNSGAEAVENALKLASFVTGKKKIIAMQGAFHGRTSAAVAVTDNPKIKAPINDDSHVVFVPMNDIKALEDAFTDDVCAVIIEPIQGVNGVFMADPGYLRQVEKLCASKKAMFIADEIQCGYGRTGKFFAHQHASVEPHLVTMAKGMGNGFPIGGVLIHPDIKPSHGMLGTTFGGSPLACAAAIAVLDVIEDENLVKNAAKMGEYLDEKLRKLPEVKEIRGEGLMKGVEFNFPIKELRNALAMDEKVLTGNSSQPNTLRLLPTLNISKDEIGECIKAIKKVVAKRPIIT